MVHVTFDVNSVNFGGFSPQQGGSFFTGTPYQRGYGVVQQGRGLGNVLAGLWKFVLPALRKLGIDVGKEALATGERVMSNLAEGENLDLKDNLKIGARNVLAHQTKRYQSGGGKRPIVGRAFNVHQIPPPPLTPSQRKRRKEDVFD